MKFNRLARCLFSVSVLAIVLVAFAVDSARAIPAFSRKYETSCVTCHYTFPQLNGFGKAFRNNGYRYPGDDRDMVKQEPVSLGNEHYKQVWPGAVWPSDIPGGAPLSIHAVGRLIYDPNAADGVVNSTFEMPHEAALLYGGTIGDDFSFMGEIEVENDDNDVEIGSPFRLEWNVSHMANFVIGSLNADPTPDHHRLTVAHYNVASLRSRNGLRLRGEKPGLGLWGAANGAGGGGGFYYFAGVSNGQGINDENREKDVFVNAQYKIGGLGQLGGTEGQASNSSASYKDDHLTLGAFSYVGTAGSESLADKEDVTIFGGIVDAWYNRLILNAGMMSMASTITNEADRNSMAWYAQGQFVIYPWLVGLARFESTDPDTDDTVDAQTTVIPGLVAALRANVKLTFEYQRALSEHDARQGEDRFLIEANFAL